MQELSPGIYKLKIKAIIPETDEAKSFVLEPADEWEPVYLPGQFLTLVFYTKHGEKRRSYSISSAPVMNERLCITVKRVENGEFSRLLTDHARVGDKLYTSGISGLFLLPVNIKNKNQYFFIAAGSGITPCFSMIKTILAGGYGKVVLIYSNRRKEDAIFFMQLKKLQEDYSEIFIIRFLFSDILDVYQSRLSNWLLPQLLDEYLIAKPADVLFYLCGPFEYMRMVNITLLTRIPAKNIFKENFNSFPRVIIPKPPDTEQHIVTIKINGEAYTLPVKYPATILKAAKAKKIVLPYSCEAGRCGSCVATCTKGKVWMAYNEVLMDDEVKRGRTLVCQAYPVEGDVEICFP